MNLIALVLLSLALILPGVASAQAETFDCGQSISASCSTSATGFPYNGWTNDPGDLNTSFRLDGGGTSSGNTGPVDDRTGGGLYVYLETTCFMPNPNQGWLLSPTWDASGIAVPTLRFWYHMRGSGMGTLAVEESDGLGGWTQVWSLSGDQGNAWLSQEVAVNTFDVGNGPQARIRFVGIRGSSQASDMAIDDVSFGEPGPPPAFPAPVHQANSPNATLVLEGTQCVDYTGGLCGAVAPLQRTYATQALMRWDLRSGSNGPQPFALFHTPNAAASGFSPGIGTVAGFVDLSPTGVMNLSVILDGIGGTTFLDQALGTTVGSNGVRTLQFTMPAGTPGTTLTTCQALFADPTAAFGLWLTAATQIDHDLTGPLPLLPSSFIGQAPVSGLLAESTVNFVFGSGFTFEFYGASYSSCWINSNGSLSFGAAGDPDATESVSDLENEGARIAAWWDDLNPLVGGLVATTNTATEFVASWIDVPEDTTFGFGANSFAIRLNGSTGQIDLAFAGLTSRDALVGISPGANSPGGPPTPGVSQPLATATPGSISGSANDSLFEVFSTDPGYGYRRDLCAGLVTGRTQVSFVPNPPSSIPGDQGYSAP